MSEGLNRVTLIGNLGNDPELRFTQSQQGVLTLRMATTESYFDNNTKERKERTEWHTVVIWGKRGEALGKILTKGSRVCIEGRLQTRTWEDKQGSKRYSTEVNAQNVILLGGRGEGAGKREDAGEAAASGAGHDDGGQSFSDDDIPF
jgi:single-strand DNA-binding protein